jgi:hypothetical protein
LFFICGLLAFNAQANPWNGLAACLGYGLIAFVAFPGTVPTWQLAACARNGIFHTGIDLFLDSPVFGKTSGHEILLRDSVNGQATILSKGDRGRH